MSDDTTPYTLDVNPAFCSRATVKDKDGNETELYKQTGSYRTPDGKPGPPIQHMILFKGGPYNRDVVFSVLDPKQRVKRITVEFYGDGHTPGGSGDDSTVETLNVDNDAHTCPPHC